MKPITPTDWNLQGKGRMTDGQRRLLNSACGDLEQIEWHGNRLSKDDWRHLISGTVLGWRTLPGIDLGDGPRGLVMLGGSSLELTRSQATDAIVMAFHIGDVPGEQGLNCNPVHWSTVVRMARGIRDSDDRDAERYAA